MKTTRTAPAPYPAGRKLMSEPIFTLLDSLSEAAVLIREGTAAAFSPLARHYLPQLQVGAPAPDCLPRSSLAGGGLFSAGSSAYSYTNTPLGQDQLLIFRPAAQTAITDVQLDGAVRQLRQFLGEILMETDAEATSAPFRKTFYRMLRLLKNLDYLHQEDAAAPAGTLDFAGLCRQTAEEAAPLLLQGRIELDYTCPDASLLIPGDPGLLRYMVLELIANSARAVGQGQVHLQLKAQGSRVLLTVSDSGAPLSRRQLASLIQQDSDQNIPSAGAGAGLGLSVVRRVVALHRGTMLVEWGDGAPVTLISLPAGPLNPRATVSTSGLQRDGGLSPLLTALADVLPVRVFELAELD